MLLLREILIFLFKFLAGSQLCGLQTEGSILLVRKGYPSLWTMLMH